MLRQANFILKQLMCGLEKAMLDVIFPKVAIANTVKFGCFYNGRRE